MKFGFRYKSSTSYSLIHLPDKIGEQISNEKFVFGIFVALQKAFDTVDHAILIQKLNQYGIRGVANKWLSRYLQNRLQYVSINSFNSNWEHIHCGTSQVSILGPLLLQKSFKLQQFGEKNG